MSEDSYRTEFVPWRKKKNPLKMVTHQPKDVHYQPKDGHPPEGNVLQTSNLALKHYLQNYHQVATAMHSHLSSLGWSFTNPRMVTHQPKDVHHQPKDGPPPEGNILQTSNLALKHYLQNYHQVASAMHSHLSSLGWSPTNSKMVTHQKDLEFGN